MVAAALSVAVSAEGDVDVVADPQGERNVPTAPELGWALGFEGRVEVGFQAVAKEEGQADCHVGIS